MNSYRRRHYAHSDDAHAALIVLESFGHRAGIVETKVLMPDDGEATEYEVWCWCSATVVATAPRAVAANDVEPDEHDVGRSTLWDDEDERRRYGD